jgi:hypothetical protein
MASSHCESPACRRTQGYKHSGRPCTAPIRVRAHSRLPGGTGSQAAAREIAYFFPAFFATAFFFAGLAEVLPLADAFFPFAPLKILS